MNVGIQPKRLGEQWFNVRSQEEKGLEGTGWSKVFPLGNTTRVGGDAYWAVDIKIWRNKAAEVELGVNCTEVKGKNAEVAEITEKEES